jgi:outer membrane receptor for ferrienterochelin and colicins
MNHTLNNSNQLALRPVLYLGIISLSSLLSSKVLSAPNESQQYKQLDEYVITGTRTQKLLIDSPVKVEIVTKEDIRLNNSKNLKDALENVPGISLRPVHGKNGYEVWMQGVDGKRVLVLVDSERVSRSTNGTTDLTQISVLNIAQIEIVKGATSALYGSNAIGGVINVITEPATQELSYTLQGDLGSYGSQNTSGDNVDDATRSAAGNIQISEDKWDAQLSLAYDDTDGHTKHIDPWTEEGHNGSTISSSAAIGYSPEEGYRLYLGAIHYDEEVFNQYNSTGPYSKSYRKSEEADRLSYKAGAEILKNGNEIDLKYFHETFNDITTQDLVSRAGLEQYRESEHLEQSLSINWNYDPSLNRRRTLGLLYTDEEIEQLQWKIDDTETKNYSNEIVPGADARRIEFYAQEDVFFDNGLEILPGFRYQHDSDFGTHFTPKINGRYELTQSDLFQTSLRFGFGRGYRVPTLKERYYEFDHRQHGYIVLGNEDLKPEYSDSFQIGWVLSSLDNLMVDVNLFRNHLRDFIETELSHVEADGTAIYQYGNIERARTQGMELVYQYKLLDEFEISGGYTLLHAKDRDTNLWLAKLPRNVLKTTFDYKPFDNKHTTLRLNYRWESKSYFDNTNIYESPSHSIFDFKVAHNFGNGISAYTGVDNITDVQKENNNDLRPTEGRYFYLGLRVENF